MDETIVSYGCTLEETDLTGAGFTNVTLSGSGLKNNDVNLSGDFDLLTVSSPSKVNLLSGSIQKMVVNSGGKGSAIDLASKTTVNFLEVHGASDFTGKGTIKKADLKVNGSTFETPPQSYEGNVLVPSITPKHGATNISVDSVIKLSFGEAIYRSSGASLTASYVEDSVIELRKGSSSGSTVSFDVSLSSNNSVITITPDSKLERDTKYYVILKGGTVRSGDGLKNEAQTYYFNTGEDNITLEPTPNPKNGATNVATSARITLTFDEAIYQNNSGKSTVTSSYLGSDVLELREGSSSGTQVKFSASITGNKVITITPTNGLSNNSKYYVIVKGGSIQNSSGKTNSRFISSFTCGTAEDVLVPIITPQDGAIGVPASTDIELRFDEALYDASGNRLSDNSTSRSYVKNSVVKLTSGSATGSSVSFSVSSIGSNRNILLVPSSNLSLNTVYYVTIQVGTLQNANGEFNQKQVYSFKVGTGLSMTITPKNGASDVERNSSITLDFRDRVYQPGAIELVSGNVSNYMQSVATLKDNRGNPVSFTARIADLGASGSGKRITLTPTEALAASTTYTLTIPENKLLSYSQGQPSEGNAAFSSSFTTSSSVLVPTVTPANDSVNVQTDTAIHLAFAETLYYKDGKALTKEHVMSSVAELRAGSKTGTSVGFTADILNGKEIVLKPIAPLAQGTTYYVILKADTLQNSSSSTATRNKELVYRFTTVAEPSMDAPRLTSFDIQTISGEKKHQIELSFEEAVYDKDKNSLSAEKLKEIFVLRKGSTSGLAVSLEEEIVSERITLTPDQLLEPGVYYLTAEKGLLSNEAGNKNQAIQIKLEVAAPVVNLTGSDIGKDSATMEVDYTYPGTLRMTMKEGSKTEETVVTTFEPPEPKESYEKTINGMKEGVEYTVTLYYKALYTGSSEVKKTYTFRTAAVSTDTTLSKVWVEYGNGGKSTAELNAGVYETILPSDYNKVTVIPIPNDAKATVSVAGGTDLGNGAYEVTLTGAKTTVEITVKAESGSTAKYTLEISQ